MCGHYRLSRRKQIIEEHFDTAPWDDDWNPRYNIAPTQPVPVIRQHPKEPIRQLSLMRWGLIPHWSKDPSVPASTINARSETAAEKPAYRDPLKFRRCLIAADGFYEWKRTATSKQPFCFEVNDGELFAFAGLWDGWKDASGNWIKSCSILTTTPNAVTSAIHDRMPVILDPSDYDLWLDLGMQNVGEIEVAKFKPKNFRSSYATNRLRSGYTLPELRDQMGHRDVKSIEHYRCCKALALPYPLGCGGQLCQRCVDLQNAEYRLWVARERLLGNIRFGNGEPETRLVR